MKNTVRNFLFAATFAAACAGVAPAEVPDWAFAFQSRGDRNTDRAYQQGRNALDRNQWDEAVRAFDEVPAGSSRRDAALYWKAYALNKAGRRTDALAAIADLEKSFPSSAWINDAKALQVDMGQPVNADAAGNEDLKIMVIMNLMNNEPERALPLLEKVLRGSDSPKVKERALFVLTQSDSPKAREIVAGYARGNGNPDLQLKAIEYLGLFGGKASRQTLSDIYAGTSDVRIKRQILRSFMLSGERSRLFAAAKEEKDASLRHEAIRQLGLMHGTQELAQLYQGDPSAENRRAVLEALFLAGDTQRIGELARNEKDPAVRMEAVKRLGLMGKGTAGDLLALYGSDAAVRKAVIQALFLQGNSEAIADLARKESDPELKADAIRQLGLMGPNNGAMLVEMYSSAGASQEVKKAVIQALFLQNNAKPLIEIARKESDPELKKDAVQKLSLMHSKEATDYLMEILK